NEGNIWYFGFNAGIDFNSGVAVALSNGTQTTNQLVPDMKIYCSHNNQTSLSSIDNPDVLGTGCNFNLFGFSLASPSLSKFGLPNFYNPIFFSSGFTSENFCFGDSTFFTIDTTGSQVDSVLWSFGDPSTGVNDSSTSLNAFHIFSVAGTYDVTLISFSNNGADTTTQQVIILPSPSADLGPDTSLCGVDSLLLDVTNNNAAYLWHDSTTNPFYTVSQSGFYYVQVTLGECKVSDSINVNLNPLPIITISNDTTICEGDTVFLFASGGTTYLWNTGEDTSHIEVFPTDTTFYEVIVTDSSGCMDKDTVTVNVNPLPVADAGVNIVSNFEVNFFNYSTNADSILWDFGDGNSDTTENPTHIYLFSGAFEVSLYAFNDCGVDTLTFTPLPISIDKDITNPEISVYPNPARKILHIDIIEAGYKPLEIKIVSLDGKILKKERINQHQNEFTQMISLENLASGMYFLILSGENFRVTEKFILQK
ncbi:MAG: T9SS type A sorting domain-containing protein, partial [Bacteroidetes bacterium]|nr:T9SS type A sorting domain-containing protein [Bacteroidota bacterium]